VASALRRGGASFLAEPVTGDELGEEILDELDTYLSIAKFTAVPRPTRQQHRKLWDQRSWFAMRMRRPHSHSLY
jgi:hypothetical protein